MLRLFVILVVGLHFLFVATAVFGGLAVFKWPRFAWVHVPVFLWAGIIVIFPWPCPLTVLELGLRNRCGMSAYAGGFLVHYVHPMLRAIGLGPIIPSLGYFVLGLNLGIYCWIYLRFRRRNICRAA